MADIFVGKQPIYNQNLGVYGYELLFRSGHQNAASFDIASADSATSTTIINSFMDMGLDKLVGNRKAFLNLTEYFLTDDNAMPLMPENVVLEVLEDIEVNKSLVRGLVGLKKRGFTIALDDYIYNPAHKPMLPLASIIKIDIMQLDEKELIKHVKQLSKYKASLLAEKIETLDEFEFCQDLGFEFFQGYFLSKPRIVKGESLPTNKLSLLNLLAILQNPDSDTEELEEAISFDVAISYKILKLINSAFFNTQSKIESIRQAIVMLGRNQLRSWASMLALSNLEDRPSEMMHLAMTRAKMCELLAEKAHQASQESYFTVGLFSALDILMERELVEVIKPLPLSEDVVAALLHKKGVIGEALKCVLAYEVSDFENAQFQNLSANDLFVANVEAVSWSNMVVDTL
ncbi:MAG: HDOD domain-containing protein [Gammaproteobacteria bacterium]|nr:HDOD domain-containing protein [Gammaproteobacteria bacterium]MCW8910110.1 HDOD domain-containing protein [Gammaproteobacteria bacterium]MCW9005038.1 HDOD domain-containing protein [Gammaproteobacteria bacterium]MCW9056562.1 HDOD domain-containing protein [Gammaproteobacteria bacterium]